MNDVAAVVIVVVGIVVVVIGSKTEPYEHVSVKSVVKSTTVEAAAGKAGREIHRRGNRRPRSRREIQPPPPPP